MKISEGVEWAIHCCTLLANLPDEYRLSKSKLAVFFDLREHYLAKFMQKLSAAGIITSTRGVNGGYRLAKPPSEISVLSIVIAVEGESLFFRCTEIRQCGPSAVDSSQYPKPCGIARTMWRAEKAWRKELSQTSLADIQLVGIQETPPEQVQKALYWFENIMD
ncbi:MAG: Rrf2 family transcriptional regulator [Kangiellaceae bacterium]|nr:Rrf2 family transcriptional regulator [Kangiellaceae bacterium]